jgi:hypothetical protein
MQKLIKSLVGLASGGEHPREIGVAVLLGTLAGFLQGWNLAFALVLLAALVLRASWKMFAQAWAVALALAWTLTPLTYRVGQVLLNLTPLGDWLTPHADSVWLVFFDLDCYTLLGGLVVGPIFGLPAACCAGWAVLWLQRRYEALKDWQELQSSRVLRFAWWFLMGTSKGAKQPAKAPWFRPAGASLTGLVMAPAMIAGWFLLPSLAERGVLQGMTAANQAEVNAERLELSLSEGVLTIEGLQFADPANLDQDRLRVEHLTAMLKPGPLLRGNVVVEQVLVDGISCDVPRERRARPFSFKLPDFAVTAAEPGDSADKDSYSLPNLMPEWKQLASRFRQLQQLLEGVEKLAELRDRVPAAGQKSAPSTAREEAEISPAYRELRSRRHSFAGPRPRVWIQDVRVRGMPADWGLGQDAALQLTDLASDPRLAGRPARLLLVGYGGAVQASAVFNVHSPGVPHLVAFSARDISLQKLVDPTKLSGKMNVGGGKLTLTGKGTMTGQGFDLPLSVSAKELDLKLASASAVGGLSADLWNQGLNKLGGLELQARVTGRWSAPRLHVDADELAARLQDQLRAAGHDVLSKAVEQQLARGQQLVQKAVEKERQKIEAALNQGEQAAAQVVENVKKEADQAQQAVAAGKQQIKADVDKAMTKLGGGLFGDKIAGAIAENLPHREALPARVDAPKSEVAPTATASNGAGQVTREGSVVGPYTELRPSAVAPRVGRQDPYSQLNLASPPNTAAPPVYTQNSSVQPSVADTRTPGQVYADRYSGAAVPSTAPAIVDLRPDRYAPQTTPSHGASPPRREAQPDPAYSTSPPGDPYPTTPYPATRWSASPEQSLPYPNTQNHYPGRSDPSAGAYNHNPSPANGYSVPQYRGNPSAGSYAETPPALSPRRAAETTANESVRQSPRLGRKYDFYEDEAAAVQQHANPNARMTGRGPAYAPEEGGHAIAEDSSVGIVQDGPHSAPRWANSPIRQAPAVQPGFPQDIPPEQSDEWRIKRWTRQAKEGVTGMIFGASETNPPQPQNVPPQNLSVRPGPTYQPPQYQYAPQYDAQYAPPQNQPQPSDARYGQRPSFPRPGMTSRQSQNLPLSQPQAQESKPWYKFW